jgi:hypothetical protein
MAVSQRPLSLAALRGHLENGSDQFRRLTAEKRSIKIDDIE